MSITFTFNSIASTTYGIKATNIERPTPERKDTWVEIDGRDGSYVYPGSLSDRKINVECVLTKTTNAEIRSAAESIANWLDTDDMKQLYFSDEPTKLYIVKQILPINIEQVVAYGKFNLEFRGESIAKSADITSNFVADALTLNNDGTKRTYPKIDITVNSACSEVKVSNGGKYVRVVNSFSPGNTVSINCKTQSVKIGGSIAMSKLDWQNSDFFAIEVGSNSLALYPLGKCSASITWQKGWL